VVTGQQELGKMPQHSNYCPGVKTCTVHRQCNWWRSESFTEYSVMWCGQRNDILPPQFPVLLLGGQATTKSI